MLRHTTGCFLERFVLLIYVLHLQFFKAHVCTYHSKYKTFEFYFLSSGNDLHLNLLIPCVTGKYEPSLSAYAQLEAAQQQSNKKLLLTPEIGFSGVLSAQTSESPIAATEVQSYRK